MSETTALTEKAQGQQQQYSLAPRSFHEVTIAAERYARSSLVPDRFRGKPDDCFVAIQLAARQNVDPLMLMQHSYVVHGSPGIEGKYAIALMNARGPFKGGVQFEYSGEGDTRKCVAWAIHAKTGQRCEAKVDMEMVKANGWDKNSKWTSMRDQMFAYRSGAFLARIYCPEVLMGMQTVEELEDIKIINPVEESKSNGLPDEGLAADELSEVEDAMERAAGEGTLPEWWESDGKGIWKLASQSQRQRIKAWKDELKEKFPGKKAKSTETPAEEGGDASPPFPQVSPDSSAGQGGEAVNGGQSPPSDHQEPNSGESDPYALPEEGGNLKDKFTEWAEKHARNGVLGAAFAEKTDEWKARCVGRQASMLFGIFHSLEHGDKRPNQEPDPGPTSEPELDIPY
ncbi:MAG: hypothetical protein ACE5ER_09815 [Nitrospinaceae bacterium]